MSVEPTAAPDAAALTQARAWIESADRIMVLTGAGVSAESGVATFRDALTGLWEKFKPEDMATEAAYRKHPRMVWDWYQERRERVLQAQPNPAHLAIAALAKRKTVTLVTQNVDGLHQRAGSEGVIELHGNLFANKWLGGCGKCDVATAEPGRPPRCATCGAMLRPGGGWSPPIARKRRLARAMCAWWWGRPALCIRRPVCPGAQKTAEPRSSWSIRSQARSMRRLTW